MTEEDALKAKKAVLRERMSKMKKPGSIGGVKFPVDGGTSDNNSFE